MQRFLIPLAIIVLALIAVILFVEHVNVGVK